MATAADWPGFRGPNRDGLCTETGLLKQWPKDGPPLVWTAKNLGLGFGDTLGRRRQNLRHRNATGKDGVWALKESDSSEIWFTPLADFPKIAP